VRRAGAESGPLPPNHLPDLVVLAEGAVPNPQLATRLSVARVPHLLVRAGEGYGAVGPMVIPGRTSCVRCLNLHTAEADPCWPAVAVQLANRPQQADLATTNATAALAVPQVLALLHRSTDPQNLPCWEATIEVDAFSARTQRTPAPPHPRCNCGSAKRGEAQQQNGTRPDPAGQGQNRLTSRTQP
jgi:bacteriocin biosynthesis cyclodehydratase domain-containing protein